MPQDTPSRKLDQYIIRFPDGMRDEIKRLAAEDGRSMNAQIIELLNFALKNSGLDIDEILQMVAAQRKEMADLRKQMKEGSPIGDRSDMRQQLEELRQALKQKDGLLMAVCLQIFMNREALPPESLVLADALLNRSGELDLLSLNEEEVSAVPEARYHSLVRRFLMNQGGAKTDKEVKSSSPHVERVRERAKQRRETARAAAKKDSAA